MNIRKADISDVEELRLLNEEFFGESRDYTSEIESKSTIVIVGVDEDKIIGISGLKIKRWNNTGLVFNIFVHPNFRGSGFGSQLINEVIKEAKAVGLRCLIAEAPSEGNAPFLFEKLGFRNCGYNDRYYSNTPGEIAKFYSLDLK